MRIGIIGCGRMGTIHARSLARLGGHSLMVYDVARESAERLADSVGAIVLPSADAIMNEAEGVVITTSSTERIEILKLAFQASLPLFCEKPLSASIEEARELAEGASAAHVTLHVGFHRRCDPEYLALREAMKSGRLGQILLIQCTAFDRVPPSPEFERSAGDIFTDLLIHDIDVVHWLTGSPAVTVQADEWRVAADAHASEVTVASLTMGLADGTRAVLATSRLDPLGYDHRIEVLGTSDVLAVGLGTYTPVRRVRTVHGNVRTDDARPAAFSGFEDRFASAYLEEMREFVRVAAGERPSPCNEHEALAAQEVAYAAVRSARRGQRVHVSTGGALVAR